MLTAAEVCRIWKNRENPSTMLGAKLRTVRKKMTVVHKRDFPAKLWSNTFSQCIETFTFTCFWHSFSVFINAMPLEAATPTLDNSEIPWLSRFQCFLPWDSSSLPRTLGLLSTMLGLLCAWSSLYAPSTRLEASIWEGWHLSCFPGTPLPLAGLRAQEDLIAFMETMNPGLSHQFYLRKFAL